MPKSRAMETAKRSTDTMATWSFPPSHLSHTGRHACRHGGHSHHGLFDHRDGVDLYRSGLRFSRLARAAVTLRRQLEKRAGRSVPLVFLIQKYQFPLVERVEPLIPIDFLQSLSAVSRKVDA